MKYVVVYEKAVHNYSAYVPDLPGCVATGKTQDEVARNIRSAMAFHLEGLRKERQAIPTPRAWVESVEAVV